MNTHDDLLTALSSARAWVDSMPNQTLANQCRDSDWYPDACTAIDGDRRHRRDDEQRAHARAGERRAA